MGRPPTNLPRLTFRFPNDLRRKLEEAAAKANRSVNAEVVARLEKSFEADDDLEQMKRLLDEHENQLEEIEKTLKRLGRNMDIVADRVGIEI